MSKDSRYERQLIVPQIGVEGQEKLAKSKVTVVGCGGLGSPVLTYLALAGVGHIRLIDCDVVSFNCKFKSQKPFTFTLTIVHLILQISIDSIAEYSRIRIK